MNPTNPLIDFRSLVAKSNNVQEPAPNTVKEGQLVVDRLGDVEFSFVYCMRYIDPNSIDYIEKHTGEEEVLNMDSTQQYIAWYKQGIEPMPITVIFLQGQNKFVSTNRRRLLAARAAGIKKIPAFVEVGRWRDLKVLF